MKIAQLIPHFFSGVGGLQVCVHNICKHHVKNGAEVYVFHSDAPLKGFSSYYTLKRIFNSNIDRIFQKFSTKFYPFSKYIVIFYVDKLQKKYNFDLWQINGGYPCGAFLVDYFRSKKIPCVLRCSGDDIQISEEFDYGVRRNPRIDRIIKENYRKYTALVAITETVKEEYKKIGVPDENIELIPNGVDFERIATFPSTDHIRKKHNIPFNAKVILTVGRNHPKKGYSLIPEILRRILGHGLDVYWVVIGKGSSLIERQKILNKDMDRLILIEEISFGCNKYDIPSDELIQYYKSADLFAMTSMLETFGIVLIEAMAAGLPVVCFDAPGIRDVMNPECGAVCKYGDTESFTQAIIKIVSEKSSAALSARCHEHARQYSWDIIADQYLSLYNSLLLNRHTERQ